MGFNYSAEAVENWDSLKTDSRCEYVIFNMHIAGVQVLKPKNIQLFQFRLLMLESLSGTSRDVARMKETRDRYSLEFLAQLIGLKVETTVKTASQFNRYLLDRIAYPVNQTLNNN